MTERQQSLNETPKAKVRRLVGKMFLGNTGPDDGLQIFDLMESTGVSDEIDRLFLCRLFQCRISEFGSLTGKSQAERYSFDGFVENSMAVTFSVVMQKEIKNVKKVLNTLLELEKEYSTKNSPLLVVALQTIILQDLEVRLNEWNNQWKTN